MSRKKIKKVTKNPDVLKCSLPPTFKGVAWALDHPAETLKMYSEFRPEMKPLVMKEGFDDARNFMLPGMHPLA